MNLFFSISSLIRKQTAPVGTCARHPFHLQSTLVLGLAYTCSPKVSFVTLGLPFKTFFLTLNKKKPSPANIRDAQAQNSAESERKLFKLRNYIFSSYTLCPWCNRWQSWRHYWGQVQSAGGQSEWTSSWWESLIKGILPKKFFHLNLIFWIVMGCGMARFGLDNFYSDTCEEMMMKFAILQLASGELASSLSPSRGSSSRWRLTGIKDSAWI